MSSAGRPRAFGSDPLTGSGRARGSLQLFQVPWYVDIVNYLACGIMSPELTYQQKR